MSQVLLLIASFPDSLLTFRGHLLDDLQKRGLTVHVAAPDLPIESDLYQQLLTRGLVVHNIPLRRTGMNPLTDLRLLLFLWRLMRRIQPDMVMGYTIKPVIYGSFAAWLARVPQRFALITGLGYVFQGSDNSKHQNRRRLLLLFVQNLYRLALSRVDKVFFQNPDNEAMFRNSGILKPKAASIIINGSGVDLAEYAVAPVPMKPHFLLMFNELTMPRWMRCGAMWAKKTISVCEIRLHR